MGESLNDNERLLIKLEQQLENTNQNQEKVKELTTEIFSKIDCQLKEIFEIKSKLETMKEVNELKFNELKNQTTYAATKAKNNEIEFKDFEEKTFKPMENELERAKGAIGILKYIYPTIALILQIIGVGVAIWLSR
jgi:hypothetical protein